MPLDGTVISAIANELRPVLMGNRIEKIYQPESDELLISLRHQRNNVRLLLSAHNQYPRIQLTSSTRNNPSQPPVFCMLLRKHLSGGRIVGIEQPHFERMLILHVEGTDELNQTTKRGLVIEMMGKHSNIILVDMETNQIIDSIKRIPLHISRKRQVLPGLRYEFPPSDKVSPLTTTTIESFEEAIILHVQQSLKNMIIGSFNGFSPPIALEIIHRSLLDPEQRWEGLTTQEQQKVVDSFFLIQQLVSDGAFTPVIYQQNESGKYMDFSVLPMLHLSHLNMLETHSVSELLDMYYGQKDHQERLHQRSQDLRKTVTIKRNRLTHKLQNLLHDEENAARADKDKMKADLIMANIHTIQPGQKTVKAINYFEESQPEIDIVLDTRKSASQNAQSLYKRYQKSKTALVEIAHQRKKTLQEIMYLDQILLSIEQADSLQDMEMIRKELVEMNYLKHKPSKNKKSSSMGESKPLVFYSSKKHVIRVGKNNVQNELVTFKLSKKNDLWFHVKDLPGSHVVLSLEQEAPSSNEIIEAALLAAYYSKGRQSSNIPVDYTWCKYVRKQRGAQPGMVIYEHHQTIYITPKESLVEKIRQNEEKSGLR